MPRFYLHLHDGDHLVEDIEGQIYSNAAAAISDATYAARDMLAECVRSHSIIDGQHIRVCDEAGEEVAIVRFAEQLRLLKEPTLIKAVDWQ